MSSPRLASFILHHIDPIMSEWETFARTRIPAAATMSLAELRDHAADMLVAIAEDMQRPQSEDERKAKSRGQLLNGDPAPLAIGFASTHGEIRHLSGFDLTQVVSEFRALRAAVLRLWRLKNAEPGLADFDDFARFSESIDQALAESVIAFSDDLAESRDTFLAVLGHDLRGPLASLSNCMHLQSSATLSTDTRESVSLIAKRSIASMDGMITDLLEYTKTRLGRGMEVVAQTGDLGVLCEETLEEVRSAHPGLRFEYSHHGDLGAVFDKARVHQVLVNLLGNAAQHGDNTTPIVLLAEQGLQCVDLTVRNSGRPIPPEAMQVIFNPLVQVASSKSQPHERPSTSLGLGLFIAREIVLAHGGSISVTSSAEAGTAFRVSLPCSGRHAAPVSKA